MAPLVYAAPLSADALAAATAADELGAQTVALPPFGSTPPYWPLDQAIRCTFSTLLGTPTGVREVVLVLRSVAAYEGYAEALARQ